MSYLLVAVRISCDMYTDNSGCGEQQFTDSWFRTFWSILDSKRTCRRQLRFTNATTLIAKARLNCVNWYFQGVQDRDIDFLFTLFRGETWFELAAYKKY